MKLDEASLTRQPEEVFDILNKLGEGSYGSVYKAIHKDSRQVLAIKQVPVDTDLQEIIKEISIMQQCDSPYVVKYYGSYFKNTDLWVGMLYYETIMNSWWFSLACFSRLWWSTVGQVLCLTSWSFVAFTTACHVEMCWHSPRKKLQPYCVILSRGLSIYIWGRKHWNARRSSDKICIWDGQTCQDNAMKYWKSFICIIN